MNVRTPTRAPDPAPTSARTRSTLGASPPHAMPPSPMPRQLRRILANAVVAADDSRREVTLSWLAAAQEFAEEMEREGTTTSSALSVRWSR